MKIQDLLKNKKTYRPLRIGEVVKRGDLLMIENSPQWAEGWVGQKITSRMRCAVYRFNNYLTLEILKYFYGD